jgi:D-amino-acid oxidase
MKKIVVIGAGVNGLSSAVKIAEHFDSANVQVTLVSEEFSPNTTGDVSAGFWGLWLLSNVEQ